MKFLIDMNLSPELARVLRSHGYTIITLDLDFGTLLAQSHSHGPSVIQIRREDVDPLHLQAALFEILSTYSIKLEQGALIVLYEKKIRIRSLPL